VIAGLFASAPPWALPLIPIKASPSRAAMSAFAGDAGAVDLVRANKIGPIPVTPMPLAEGQ